jgi:hypothetical protein
MLQREDVRFTRQGALFLARYQWHRRSCVVLESRLHDSADPPRRLRKQLRSTASGCSRRAFPAFPIRHDSSPRTRSASPSRGGTAIALLPRELPVPAVRRVVARNTLSDGGPVTTVARCGFGLAGPGGEPETVRYGNSAPTGSLYRRLEGVPR